MAHRARFQEPKLSSLQEPRLMTTILFNAFSFLQKKLEDRKLACVDAPLDIAKGASVEDLLAQMHLSPGDVEAVFVNGLVRSVDTVLTDGDRVALVPPGSPGPYRVLLGMVREKRKRKDFSIHDPLKSLKGSTKRPNRRGWTDPPL
jgi:sulfur carrier protein ThiS